VSEGGERGGGRMSIIEGEKYIDEKGGH